MKDELRAGADVSRPHRHELDLACPIGIPVPIFVRMVELLCEVAAQWDREIERLPCVAEIRVALGR